MSTVTAPSAPTSSTRSVSASTNVTDCSLEKKSCAPIVETWVFESDGSFSENTWTQDGRRWLIQAKVTLPDGTLASAQHTLSWKDKDKYTWTSANRERDGELLPNIGPIEIVRGK